MVPTHCFRKPLFVLNTVQVDRFRLVHGIGRQEGRGIGLANKVAAYALQDGGLDTVDANRHLGFEDDLRSYEAVEHILADMGIKVRIGGIGAGAFLL